MGRGFWCGANGLLSSPKGDLIDLDPSTPYVRVSEVLLITCTGVCARWFSVHPLSYFSKCSYGGSFLPPREMSAAYPKPGLSTWALRPLGLRRPLHRLRIAGR